MHIVKAREAEAVEIVRLNRGFHLPFPWFIWDRLNWVREEIREGNFFVAKEGNRILGAICLKISPKEGRIDTLAVRRDSRRLGVGRKLVAFAKRRTRKEEGKRLIVSSFISYGVGGFYERCGFKKSSEIYWYRNQPCHRFRMNV